jgi:ferric-dicitrate binding protein FerR (iron transport regulator)
MSTKKPGGPDPLEKIFLFAGRREPVDPERAEIVEQQTHERWQIMLARRRAEQRRRRVTWIGGGIAAAASVVVAVIFMSQLMTEAPLVATVANVLGTPETGARGNAMAMLHAGDELHAGSVLETAGDDGVALQLATGHSLRVAAASRVRLEANAVVLDSGTVYLDSGKDGRNAPIEVRSRVATVRELGTQYMAQLTSNSLEVTVREGAVRVAQNDTVATALAGEMLSLDESGRTGKSLVPEYGEHWAWVTQLAPVPALEGLTLAEFLQWLAREQGWRLEYATPELARHAATVELHGSIDGLSGEEALAAVMASTGWRYTLADGALAIDARREPR